MAQLLEIGSTSGSAGPDHFAPKYLVGNVPAGDSAAAYTAGGRTYIPDPGDGSGIRAALALASITPGDVWISPGTYALGPGQGRLVIGAGTRVWGAGITDTIIVSGTQENVVWEVGGQAELAWMTVRHSGVMAPLGTEIIACTGDPTYVHDFVLDASSATAGGVITAGIAYSGQGNFGFSRLHGSAIVGPQGSGSPNPNVMWANIRGKPGLNGNSALVDVQTVTLAAGDGGIVSLGVTGPNAQQGASFIVGRAFMVGPAVVGFYADFAPMIISTGPSVVLAFASTIIGGAILLNSFQYEIGGVLLLRLDQQVPLVPGIIISGSNPPQLPSGCDIHDCQLLQWGDPQTGVPQILIGQGADVVVSAGVVNNRFISDPNVPPVELGAGATNCIVALNRSVGSGGTLVTDLGAGNAPNINNLWT